MEVVVLPKVWLNTEGVCYLYWYLLYLAHYFTWTIISIDVYGMNEKFNIGIYYGAKDNLFCIFIGSDLHSYTRFPVIREKSFTLLTFLLEEFGSSTISHLFQKCLLSLNLHFVLLPWLLLCFLQSESVVTSECYCVVNASSPSSSLAKQKYFIDTKRPIMDFLGNQPTRYYYLLLLLLALLPYKGHFPIDCWYGP